FAPVTRAIGRSDLSSTIQPRPTRRFGLSFCSPSLRPTCSAAITVPKPCHAVPGAAVQEASVEPEPAPPGGPLHRKPIRTSTSRCHSNERDVFRRGRELDTAQGTLITILPRALPVPKRRRASGT